MKEWEEYKLEDETTAICHGAEPEDND